MVELKQLFRNYVDSETKSQLDSAISLSDPSVLYDFYIDYNKLDKDFKQELLKYGDFNPINKIFTEVIRSKIAELDAHLFEKIKNMNIKARFSNFMYNKHKNDFSSLIPIKSISSAKMGSFVYFKGVIRNIIINKSSITKLNFHCMNCGADSILDFNDMRSNFSSRTCLACQQETLEVNPIIGGAGDYQTLVVEELNNESNSSQINVIIDGDLINKFELGDNVIITGNIRLDVFQDEVINQFKKQMNDHQVYKHLSSFGGSMNGIDTDWFVEANFVEHISDTNIMFDTITKEDIKQIKAMSTDHHLMEKLIASFAPDIFGYDIVKEALIYQLVGGMGRSRKPTLDKRGEIHIFLLGDPSCLVEGTKVLLADGTQKNIESLGTDHLQPIDIDIIINSRGDIGKAKIFHKFEKQKTIEIITETGKSIEGTYNHPLMTIDNGWKRLDQLKISDELQVIDQEFNYNRVKDKIIKTNFMVNNGKYGPKYSGKVPEYYDDDLLAFIGYILGDGYITNTRVYYSIQENELEDLRDELNDISYRLFGIKPLCVIRKNNYPRTFNGIDIVSKNPGYYFNINSMNVISWLNFIKNKSKDRFIPDFIFTMSNRQISIFLKWLFSADGCVFGIGERGKNSISLKSSSIRLVRDVQQLLLRFNISSRILPSDNNSYNLMIRKYEDFIKFNQYIGFVIKRKQECLKNLVEISINKRKRRKVNYEKIVSIEYKDELKNVYDVEVPEGHSFIANGIVSHNTAKTDLMLWALDIAHKKQFAYGGNMSKVGLTGGNEQTAGGKWVLTAGAASLADMGLLGIDEMNDTPSEVLSALKEIMEKQTSTTVKIRMGSNHTRVSVIGSANPPKGNRYDKKKSFFENLGINLSLFTRFDYVALFRDIPNPEIDGKVVDKIIDSYNEVNQAPYTKEMVAKYIYYMRNQRTFPILSKAASDRVHAYYVKIRTLDMNENIQNLEEQENVSITARQLQSLLRFGFASAILWGKSEVDEDDIRAGERIVNDMLNKIGIDPETGKVDASILMGSKSSKQMNRESVFRELLDNMSVGYDNRIEYDQFFDELRKQPHWKPEEIDDEKVHKYIEKCERQHIIMIVDRKISVTNYVSRQDR